MTFVLSLYCKQVVFFKSLKKKKCRISNFKTVPWFPIDCQDWHIFWKGFTTLWKGDILWRFTVYENISIQTLRFYWWVWVNSSFYFRFNLPCPYRRQPWPCCCPNFSHPLLLQSDQYLFLWMHKVHDLYSLWFACSSITITLAHPFAVKLSCWFKWTLPLRKCIESVFLVPF